MRESAATMLDPLPITPFTRPVQGAVALPGSKSITNRALLLAALSDRPVTVANALFSEDTEIMTRALLALGIKVVSDAGAKTFQVFGAGGSIPADDATLSVGNAGTAARFLTGLCAAAPRGTFRLDGVPQMRRRPMKGLIDALRVLGADIRCPGEEGFFPLVIHARGLRGGGVNIDAGESSQMLSALLMAAPLAEANTIVRLTADVRAPFVEMTINLMRHFGVEVSEAEGGGPMPGFHIPTARYHPQGGATTYFVEPDATAASYFLALPLAAGGDLKVLNITEDSLQGDTAFAGVLRRTGLTLTTSSASLAASWVRGGRKGVVQDFNAFSDTFLTLAAVAPLLEGSTRITGIGHTRKQETDRIAGAAHELRKLGQDVVEEPEALTITPRPDELRRRAVQGGIEIETYNDHRFAMSFGILGCHDLLGDGRPWLRIRNPGCCAKTFPDFFSVLDGVWRQSHSEK